ncbi:transcription initiation factor TFIID subunit 4 isoform X3 [Folsomia candida]|uniref:transcription initiation factor TFIID subunit 4 isoform X3 n=1 Tax=Folsomia candida TaxID=158441 RepID=UPI000B902241|nr:transcription initiation factor TFIID subunit 4 isoform X3 [Folsomia candida]
MPSPSPSVPQPTGNILVNGASSSGSKLPVTTTSGGFITNGIRTIIPSSAGTHSLQNGITRIVTPQGVQFPIGSIPQSNVLQNVVRTGLSGINNILSTGGVTPGIRQATLGTLISGVGANSVAAGSSGANIISSLPPGAGPAMTVNNSGGGATPGQAGQNQTVVLSKGTGVTTMTSTGTIGLSQNPSGGASANNNNVTNNQGQPITLGPGGAGGLQILNMNNLNAARAVNVGAVNSGGTTTHQIVAAGPAGSKNLAPRMIISPQVLNTRPGQPGLTLQALPGLPPGASGHLLVKTESGQYQLLRVGMSPAPPTAAATGTTVVPSTVATTTMSIAQQQLLPTSNPPSSSVSTTSATLSLNNNNSNHVVSSSHPLVSTISSSTLQQQPTSVVVSATNTSHSSQLVGKVVVSSTSGISSTNNSMTVVQTPQTIANTTTVVVTTTNAGTPSASKTGTGSSNSLSIPTNPTSPANNRLQSIPSNAANNSTMTAETAKVKCKNFLSFLLELSAKQNQQVSRNVKALIQGLVDGKVNEENFSDRLQKEVNSQPQPCLVGFLKKSLPHLRHSLATNELKIDGIKPPPLSSVVSPAPVTALIPQHAQIRTPTNHSPPVRIITPINPNSTATPPYAAPVMPSIGTNSSLSFPTTRTTPAPPSTQSKMPSTGKTAKGKSSSSASSSSSTTSSPNSTSGPSKPIASKSSAKDKDKKSFGSSAYSGDDDINDVAAMGGVNLAEESQKILGSTEFVGTQIRSVRDETFLHSIPLQARLKAIAAKHGLAEPPPEVAAIISHATEERLKNLIEKLAVIAEHRLDVIKMDDRYEVTQDVKGQLRFLEELEKLERKRHDEQEREMLIRAAKSRSKSEDPEQAKLKAKAKEMQRVAMEEMRQREANQTALEAIGPRKKPKLDSQSGSQSTISQSPLGGVSASGNRGPQMGMRPRLKRVNTRDLLFLLEQEKETSRSHFLYKNLLK